MYFITIHLDTKTVVPTMANKIVLTPQNIIELI